jgi:hypothetical protein
LHNRYTVVFKYLVDSGCRTANDKRCDVNSEWQANN